MKILIADHHPVFRRGLKCMLKGDKTFEFKGKVEDGKFLISEIQKQEPDVLILEIDLPNSNGVGSLRQIRTHFPDLKVLVVSCHPEEIYAVSSLKAGAQGFISKTRTVKEVKHALLTIVKGERFISENIKNKKSSDSEKQEILKFKTLSTREIEVLNLLSRGKRNKEIAQDLSINEKTVSTYKTRLLKKLNVDNIADLIHQSRLLQITTK
ncbi:MULTISPECIES: response regulator [Nonlabens]|uniref:DNA-binding response regulator n=1 Tax=Nonlabens agnitus TaxID=870484 RepID=A0A2S9WQ47_9FLAO|nr:MULTISPECIES: response regulator transcription factor [Nonlabens]KQC32804.1 ligand-binding protein SH3 [Nonlabens sp. YIK11]PRP65619.1 DNA-binding response regulator [Nonlabens agnitus]